VSVRLALLATLALATAVPCAAQDSLLTAPRVREQIQVRVEQKTVTFALDGRDNYFEVKKDHPFVASDPVKLTYPRLNPLRYQPEAKGKKAPDPAFAVVKELIDTLAKIPGIVAPAGGASALRAAAEGGDAGDDKCVQLANLANQYYEDFDSELADGKVSSQGIGEEWTKAIGAIDDAFGSGRTGPVAMRSGAASLQAYLKTISGRVTSSGNRYKEIQAALDKDECPTVKPALRALRDNARFTNGFERLKSLEKLLKDFVKVLQESYTADEKWLNGVYYIVYPTIDPSAAEMDIVTVTVTAISLVTDDPAKVSVKREESAAATIVVREFSRFAPEAGAGMVLAFVPRTFYGTGTNAEGKTVVAVSKTEDVAVVPGGMVNFVCRCGAGPFVEPMFQIGAAISKETPGILVGGGIRLFAMGKADIALSGGVVAAWTKKLKTLKVGDVISGSKDIDADLGFKGLPTTRPYIAILVKFGT
jgi:hypothetical protein